MTDPIASLQAALAGRYVIDRPLGQGGMATVYLAHDVRHDRQVALKVLRPELAAVIGAERFLAEIKTTANLQHPHILPLFDSGTVDGTVFYVMPFVAGESLRDRLARETQLPVPEAVRIATEVASALDYAHRHGVIHRDIKPENILLHDGQALVADFGIALAAATTGGNRMTETGMSLGTPHYMSPEQAMGERTLDARTDVYALGCVLYEMLSGDPPFQGSSAQAIVAKVMTEKPAPLRNFRDTVPESLEEAVLIALAKLPADRFPSAAAFRDALRDADKAPARLGPGRSTSSRRTAGRRAALWVAGVVAVGSVAVAAGILWRRPVDRPVSRYALAFPAAQAPSAPAEFAISADGSVLVYLGPGPGADQLWVKHRDQAEAVPIPGTTAALGVAVSPDGRTVAWWVDDAPNLLVGSVAGGPAVAVGEKPSGFGHTFVDGGDLVYVRNEPGVAGIWRVPATGGPATKLWALDSAGIVTHPASLSGPTGLLFIRFGIDARNPTLWHLDLRSGLAKPLVPGALRAQYLATGHLLYGTTEGALMVVEFDPATIELRGPARMVTNRIAVVGGISPRFSASDEGTLVVQSGEQRSGEYRALWVDRSGLETPVDTSWSFRPIVFGFNVGWSLSPDGRSLAIGLAGSQLAPSDIWIKQLPAGPLTRLTFDSVPSHRPRWTPDGRAITYVSGGALRQRRADGSGLDSVLLEEPELGAGAWSPDRRWLVARVGPFGNTDIVGLRPGIDSTPRALVTSRFNEGGFAVSPDGRWLAYESNESGAVEIYVRPFPATDQSKRKISVSGGFAPLWNRNGRELFYMTPARMMTVVAVGPGPDPKLGAPRGLFRLSGDFYGGVVDNYTPYDIAPDGARFLMAKQIDATSGSTATLIVTENWVAGLTRERPPGTDRPR